MAGLVAGLVVRLVRPFLVRPFLVLVLVLGAGELEAEAVQAVKAVTAGRCSRVCSLQTSAAR